MRTPQNPPRGIVVRLLLRAVYALALAVCFTLAAAVGIVVHTDTRLGRRLASSLLTELLSSTFQGKVVIQELAHAHSDQIFTRRAELFDTTGRSVLVLHDVRVNADLIHLAREFVFGGRELTVHLPHIRVERAEVLVVPGSPTGEPTISLALAPRSTSDAPAAREIRVWLPVIEIGRAEGRITIPGVEPFHAKVARVRGQMLVGREGVHVDVQRFGASIKGFAGADARGTATVSVRAPGTVRGTFEGFYGDVEMQASARLEDERLVASFRIPRATPAAVSAHVPGWPVREPVAAEISIDGELPELATQVRLEAGSGVVRAEGKLSFQDPFEGRLTARARDVDLRLVFPDAPATRLGATADLRLFEHDGKLAVEVRGSTRPTVIEGQSVPAADVEGVVDARGFTGKTKVHEPGLPIDANVAIDPEGVITVDATLPSFSLGGVPRLPKVADGRGSARIQARIEGTKVDARVTAHLNSVRRDDLSIERARVSGTVRGTLDRPERLAIDARLEGGKGTAAGYSFDSLTATARGRYDAAAFTLEAASGERTVSAKGDVSTRGRLVVKNTELRVAEEELSIEGKVGELDLERGVVDIDTFRVTGVGGDATGSIRLGKDLIEAEVQGENIDLGRLSKALGVPGLAEGRARINAQLTTGRDVTRGRLRLAMGNVAVGNVAGLSMQVAAELDDRELSGQASGLLANVGTFGAEWKTELDGPAFRPESWQRMTGTGELIVSEVQLPVLALLFGKDQPFERVAGRGYAQVRFERDDPEVLPNLLVTGTTRGLGVTFKGKDRAAGLAVTGMDIHATGGVNGATGEASGAALLVDSHGELVTMNGTIRTDFERWLADPAAALAALPKTPFDVVFRTPERPLDRLPPFLRPEGLTGSAQASLLVKGTLDRPTAFLTVNGRGLVADSVGAEPLDVRAVAEYDPESRHFAGRGTASACGRAVAGAVLDGTWTGDAQTPWTGDLGFELDGLPLALFSGLAKDDVQGSLAGKGRLSRRAGEGKVDVDVRLTGASVQGTPIGDGTFRVTTDGAKAEASLALLGQRGKLEAAANSRLEWTGRALPALEASAPIAGNLLARDFDLVALSPVLRDVFARVGGRANADVRFDVRRVGPEPANGRQRWSGTITGHADVSEGVALIEPLGLELRDIQFHARAYTAGTSTLLDVRKVRAKARSQKDNVFGNAQLRLEGPVVVTGVVGLQAQDMPLLLRGVLQGRATGQATAKLTRKPDYMLVEVSLPELTTRLPRATKRDVFDAEDNPDIFVLQFQTEEVEKETGLPWQLILQLGERVRVRSSEVDMGLTGTPVIELGERLDVYGTIDLTPGGRIPVLGKVFVIDSGRVFFDTGDAGNPRLDVTAEWRAPDGTVVFVDVGGTMQQPKVTLRSDPPLPENQVFAILLGGASATEPVVQDNQSTGTGAAEAVGIGSGVAALGVNELLSETPVELRVGTTSESRPRYTAAVRIGENLWFEASTYQRSEIGSNDRNVYSGTIDYRFTRRWSLRTEVGTAGGALDLLWQYRY